MLENPIAAVLAVVCSYLLGSISVALLIARSHGVDLRKYGSGNPGATNLGRAIGIEYARYCFAIDFLKGALPIVLIGLIGGASAPLWLPAAAGAAAVCGHVWPVYFRFRGGKGVATALGALLMVAPIPLVVAVAAWVAVYYTRHIVSLASIAAAAAMPMAGLVLYLIDSTLVNGWVLLLLVFFGLLILVRHHANIRRLVKGDEHTFATVDKK